MNYNSSNNSNCSFISSQTKPKEISSALYPIMSTGFNTSYYQNHDLIKDINCSIILQSPSPLAPPIPKFIVDNSKPTLLGSFDRLEESDSQHEGHTIANNVNLSRLHRDAFESTSGHEQWTEDNATHSDGGLGRILVAYDERSASNTSHTDDDSLTFDCLSHLDSVVTVCLAIISFVTPILMAVLPRLSVFGWSSISCSTICEYSAMFTAIKLCVLSIASIVLFCRRQLYSYPRVFIIKVVLIITLFSVLFAVWLVYVLRVLLITTIVSTDVSHSHYDNAIIFAANVTDILLFLHYLAIVLMEIRHLDSRYSIKVIRSPDGESRFYKVGNVSIQAAAVKILQEYILDFPMYNIYSRCGNRPSLSRDSDPEAVPSKIKSKSNTIHGESVASKTNSSSDKDLHSPLRRSTRSLGQSPHGSRHDRFPKSLTQSDVGFSGFKERLYKEMEHEKRLKKRRLRLMASGEDIFNRIRRQCQYDDDVHNDVAPKVLTSYEAAQNILAQLAKPFQKYLKLSRLQSHFPRLRITNHLVKCLQFGMSAQAFLESFVTTPKVIESSESIHGQMWTVVCNKSLCRGLSNNMTFVLKRQGVALMCSVTHIPIFSLTEDISDFDSQKFVVTFNSETSV